MHFSANPNTLPADGKSTAVIFVQVFKRYGDPLPDQTIEIGLDHGILECFQGITDEDGSCAFYFRATDYPIIVTIFVTVSSSICNLTDQIKIEIYQVPKEGKSSVLENRI